MEECFIVMAAKRTDGEQGRFSLWAAAAEVEAYIRRLVEAGTPPECIRVYRTRPLPPRRRSPLAA